MVLLLLMVSTRGECVSNSGWWVAMHLVLTLGKRRQIARLEWERGEGGFSGRQGPVDIWPCVLRSPHGPLLRPLLSSFSSSSLRISRLRNMKDPPHCWTLTFHPPMERPPSGVGVRNNWSWSSEWSYLSNCSERWHQQRCLPMPSSIQRCHLSLHYYCLPPHCPTPLTMWSALLSFAAEACLSFVLSPGAICPITTTQNAKELTNNTTQSSILCFLACVLVA